MAIAKICGIETEYGILVHGADVSATLASSLLVNAYSEEGLSLHAWDFTNERPSFDARSGWRPDADFPEVESLMANSVLSNGARYYVDHAHPEYSSPECLSPLDAVLYDRAGEEVIRASMKRALTRLAPGIELLAHKNNSDGKGNSYGCHENYLVDRSVPFGRLAREITSHFVTRQIFCGAGKVGVEMRRDGEDVVGFQISQRADFFEEEVGLETTIRRPIVNTRDEPHCDPERWRRLHVIVGDANMSEVATYLKVGTTALVLGLIEDNQFPEELLLEDPVLAIRKISHDVSLTRAVPHRNGRSMTALESQVVLYERTVKWFNSIDHDPTNGCGEDILRRWKQVLEDLQTNHRRLLTTVDWCAKRNIIEGMQSRHNISDGDARLKAIDLQYHDMRTAKCLANRVGLEVLVTQADVDAAVGSAPTDTRAYFRGECIRRWPQHVTSANWDCVVFDTGEATLQRVPMNDPFKGTKALVGNVMEAATSVEKLLSILGSELVEPLEHDPGW